MIRLLAFAIILIAALAAVLSSSEHQATNGGLPLVNTAATAKVDAPALFVPCPLAPMNFRKRIARDA